MNAFSKTLSVAFLATSMLFSVPASAAKSPFEFKPERISDKPEFPFDESKAYILVEYDRMTNVSFMKLPNEEEQAIWEKMRLEEFAKAQKKYVSRKKRYENDLAKWRKIRSGRKPEPPVEPTEGNFSITPFELEHNLAIGPQGRFNNDDVSIYLYAVPEGEYVFYGNAFFNPNGGAMGTCVCMGTVAINVEAGQIAAVRLDYPFVDMLANLPKEERPKTPLEMPEELTTTGLLPVEKAKSDQRLPQDRVVFPAMRPISRLPNWFGLEVDRLMPVEGVFRYEGDSMIALGEVEVLEADEAKEIGDDMEAADEAVASTDGEEAVVEEPAAEAAPETGGAAG